MSSYHTKHYVKTLSLAPLATM